ncbi:hypothetical protein AAMO2058_000163400 [Amorphochlora amoebiformis]
MSYFWGKDSKKTKPSVAELFPYFNLRVTRLVGDFLGEDMKTFNSEVKEKMAARFPEERLVTLNRFLVARDCDLKKASHMYSKHREFLDMLLKKENIEKWEKILGRGPRRLVQHVRNAKNGTGCIAFHLCLVTEKSLENPGDLAIAIAYGIQKAMDLTGPFWKPRFTVLAPTNGRDNAPNLKARALVPLLKSLCSVLGNNYPEIAEKIVVFPFPWIGRMLWSVVSLFIDPKTRGKVKFLGGTERRHAKPDRKLFEQYISEKNLPEGWLGPLPKESSSFLPSTEITTPKTPASVKA